MSGGWRVQIEATYLERLTRLCPSNAAVVGVRDIGQPVVGFEREAALVANSAPKRRREFALGRHCAHMALSKLGLPPSFIGRNPNRSPIWPSGIVGSISHTTGYVAAIVARSLNFESMGLDLELVGSISPEMEISLFLDEEKVWLDGLEGSLRPMFSTVIFSAKEAYFKYWSPMNEGMLDFKDAIVEVLSEEFIIHNVHRGLSQNKTPIRGRYAVIKNLVMTVICAPAERTDPMLRETPANRFG